MFAACCRPAGQQHARQPSIISNTHHAYHQKQSRRRHRANHRYIHPHHVLHGTGTFEIEPPSAGHGATTRRCAGQKTCLTSLPWMVNRFWVLPTATGSSRLAYRFSAEHSIDSSTRRQAAAWGAHCRANWPVAPSKRGLQKLIAVIGDSANTASIGVHRSSALPMRVLKCCGWKLTDGLMSC